MTSERFYAELPVITDFGAVTRAGSYAPLPDDWHVALCDVRDSTAAVQAGRYKNVNTVGAAAITAVLNAAGELDIPFSFEGDGCVLCVPPRLLEDTRAALARTRDIARESFGLDLRIATVPVAGIREAGHAILVARYRVSKHYVQAVFSGGGVAYADRLIKDAATAPQHVILPGSIAPRGSHDGLECRWRDIPSRHGETVSLMVRAREADAGRAAALYREVIARVREVYGDDDACHPVSVPALTITLDGGRLANEVGVRAAGRGPLGQWLVLMRTRCIIVLGWLLMKFGIHTGKTDWGRYKETLVRNSDVRKFVDIYRQILAGTAAQRHALDAWLKERYDRGELIYGLHVTDRAQMTCLVFNYAGRHLHFIDGADGGLFLAAKAFKERAARLAGGER
ncbi:MAG: DUF3095 domain-containing protein [Betaproteobacteria bacterium]|nr:DUF3095 domain-containing protein [Betaproteobacteria bacterium]